MKVLDFGLVQDIGAGRAVTMLSMEGTAAGTLGYMAPEAALGLGGVDGRTDIYSLGCVAYYMLTGQPVFSGDTPVAMALAHVQDAPIPPRLRSEFRIPPELDAVVMDCLAKDPGARPATAAIVSERLAAAVAPEAWTGERAHAWWERHQPLLNQPEAPTQDASAPGPVTGVVRLRRRPA